MRNTHHTLLILTLTACLSGAAEAADYQTISMDWSNQDGTRKRSIKVGTGLGSSFEAERSRKGVKPLQARGLVASSVEKKLRALAQGVTQRGEVQNLETKGASVKLEIAFKDGTRLTAMGPLESTAWGWKLPQFKEIVTSLLELESREMQSEGESDYLGALHQRAVTGVLARIRDADDKQRTLRFLQQVRASPAWKDHKLESPETMAQLITRLGASEQSREASRLTLALKSAVIETRRLKKSRYKRLGLDVAKRRDLRYSEAFTLDNVLEEAAGYGLGEAKGKGAIELRQEPEDDAPVATRVAPGTRLTVMHVLPGGEWALVGLAKDAPGVELVVTPDDKWLATGGYAKTSDLGIELKPGVDLTGGQTLTPATAQDLTKARKGAAKLLIVATEQGQAPKKK